MKHKAHNNTAMIKTVNRYIPQREGFKVSPHLIGYSREATFCSYLNFFPIKDLIVIWKKNGISGPYGILSESGIDLPWSNFS